MAASKVIWVLLALAFGCAPVLAQDAAIAPPKAGQPIDRAGNSAVDPTKNVLDLVQAAIQRQDDLRNAQDKLFQTQLAASERYYSVLSEFNKELREAAVARVASEAKLRADYANELAVAEAKRIDAIRAVDVGAAANLATRTTEQATALATVVNQSAEVLRNQVSRAAEDTRALVATTAATQLQNQQQQFAAVTTSLTAISSRVATLEQGGASSLGIGTGRSDVTGWIAFVIMFLVSAAGVVVAAFRSRPARPR